MIVSKLRLNISSAPLLWGGAFFFVASACSIKRPPEQHFYDQHIQPILNNFCVGNTSPCHRIDPASGIALGNLDLSSFESVQKRRDVLRTYGSYPQPLLLLKSLTLGSVQIPYQQVFYDSEIKHTGGNPIAPTSDAYYELKRWLDNGANRDGLAPAPVANMGKGACNTAIPPNQPPIDPNNPAYQTFIASGIQDKIRASCAFATCHSSPQSDFYMTCGDDDAQKQYNFSRAASFVTAMGIAVEQSEILLRPLAPAAGGVSHTGGVFFGSRDDEGWKSWKTWAELVQANPPYTLTKSPGQQFFEANVMPKLLQRGCALEGCHSPDGFNDFRLRSGAQGFFSPFALARNYETALKEFLALDTVDVKQSRAIKKTIFASSGGMIHRAGPVLDGFAGGSNVADSVAPCAAVYDPMTASDFCAFKEWHRIERQDHAADVSAMANGDVIPLAFVSRPPNGDNLLQFDTYQGGADLKLADAVMGADGLVASVGNVRSALGGCSLAGDVDVRGPEWSYDGKQLIFAARAGAADGLNLYVIDGGGSGTCRKLTTDGGSQAGMVRLHNFDPVFAPDGTIVYASTRSGTITLKNLLPNSDLFRVAPGGDFTKPEQLTYLLNAEIAPAFMQDGRLSFTAEKATPEFYQLSGRRMNWDRTDYHPLLAQRAQSTDTFTTTLYPSVDYQQATEIREGLDRNFLIILSDPTAKGAGGALATFNRSIGPFQADRTELTFLRALALVDPAATGRAGTAGVYRSPFSLPNGEILASYAANVTDPATQVPKYDLVAVAADGTRRALASDPSLSYVEGALGYKRAERELFTNLPQLVFGGHGDPAADPSTMGVMHFPDVPVLATLLGANLRHGRDVKAFDGTASLRVYREKPPTSMTPPLTGSQMVFSDRQPLGVAGLESDHSLKVAIPAGIPLILELIDGDAKPLLTMQEEHQLTPGEYITPGPPRAVFNGICGGCHGSLSGEELDVAVTPDALTGASVSLSRDKAAKPLQ
jgi:WD40 repeat protein